MPIDSSRLLSELLQAVLIVFIPIVITAGLDWLSAHKRQITARMSQEALYEIEQIAGLGVRAAEQYLGSKAGKDKKSMAIHTVQKYLEGRGLRLDISTVDAAIEGAVYQYFNVGKGSPDAVKLSGVEAPNSKH